MVLPVTIFTRDKLLQLTPTHFQTIQENIEIDYSEGRYIFIIYSNTERSLVIRLTGTPGLEGRLTWGLEEARRVLTPTSTPTDVRLNMR